MRVDRQFECRNKCISEKGEGKGMKKGISLLLVITLILSAYAVFLPIASGQCENIALNKPTSQFGWVENKENINDGHLSTFAYTYSYWGNAGVIIDLNDSYKLWNVKGQVYCSGSAARGYVDIYNGENWTNIWNEYMGTGGTYNFNVELHQDVSKIKAWIPGPGYPGYYPAAHWREVEAYEEDTTSPIINISQPKDDEIFTTSSITVNGTASDSCGIESVTIHVRNGSSVNATLVHQPDITLWSANVTLPVEGENIITVVATDNSPKHNKKTEDITVYYAEHYFIHMTDPHVGRIRVFGGEEFCDALTEVNNLPSKPDFILLTGDLVDWTGPYGINFAIFNYALNSSTIPSYKIPGNHDRRTSPISGNDDLVRYYEYISLPGDCEYLIPYDPDNPDNCTLYTFSKHNYTFAGLDSGKDYNVFSQVPYDNTPESDGLTDYQLSTLETLDKDIPKIIFMHHPAIDDEDDCCWPLNPVEDDAPGGNDACVAFNRYNFINYTIYNNTKLVLVGHTHEDVVFNAEGTPVTPGSNERPLFIQTRSVGVGNHAGYRRIYFSDDNVTPLQSTITGAYSKIKASASCPVNLHAYDSQNRHTGLNLTTGEPEFNIPGAFYFPKYNFTINETNYTVPETMLLYNTTEEYRFNVTPDFNSSSVFNLTVNQQTDDSLTNVSYYNVSFTENTTATLPINLTTTNYTMYLYENGTQTTREPNATEINYAPTAKINSPDDDSIWLAGAMILFNGSGTNPEEGELSNSSLYWTSSLDGVIGAGKEFVSANLSAGRHTITLRVNDSGRVLIGTDDIRITVLSTLPTVSIDNVSASPNGTITEPIMVKDVMYLASGTLNITYNSSVVHVTNVTSGDGNALDISSFIIDNNTGIAQISASNSTGKSGNVIFADITFEAVGDEGSSSPLNLTVVPLEDVWGTYIPHIVDNGTFTIIQPVRVHNLDTGEDFSTIQAAIDAVNTTGGHTITVDAGTYNENVNVNKSLTIRSSHGNPADTIVLAANSTDHVFEVTADYANISGLTIKGATGEEKAGIYLYGANHCIISNNNISNCYYGIRVSALWYCDIQDNFISNCNYGISVK